MSTTQKDQQSPYARERDARQAAHPTGTVRFFKDDRGYGFIEPDGGGPSVFVYYAAIVSNDSRRTLLAGQKVSYTVEATAKGPRAMSVRVIADGAS